MTARALWRSTPSLATWLTSSTTRPQKTCPMTTMRLLRLPWLKQSRQAATMRRCPGLLWALREPASLRRHPLHRHHGQGFDAGAKGPGTGCTMLLDSLQREWRSVHLQLQQSGLTRLRSSTRPTSAMDWMVHLACSVQPFLDSRLATKDTDVVPGAARSRWERHWPLGVVATT